jgi:uncharacterized protein YndB with AHSA1/START domain
MTSQQQVLAEFVDRFTMRYERRYPHPIEMVWDAVSTGEHLDVWMLPTSRVERRRGGRCSFTWGGDEADYVQVGTVTEFDPPRRITYAFDEAARFMRFDLAPDGDGTLLHFTLFWPVVPGEPNEPEDYPGGDLPAGPDTPWRPGFLAGFHEMLDDLAAFLRGEWGAADRAANLANYPTPEGERLIELYREHVREHCPPASGQQ